jgi:hypothetical protein
MVDAYDNWREERSDEPLDRRGPRRSDFRQEPRLEQRLDQWVSAGRQLVDGVSGARPGSRSGARPGLRLDHLGRWVEDKLDWLLEDDEGWRESWEQPPAAALQRRSQRQPLEALSRRRSPLSAPGRAPVESSPVAIRATSAADAEAWPDDENFSVSRWQRSPSAAPASEAPARELRAEPPAQRGRALPRSSRRRPA